ncbi:uncharacterized protein [Macrobrachium rosenbergii]|uniref:uncharacterized protein n=1 Tax=Macrobrachium rosenbergii TaxID=79674 RepID=UPI0034D4D5E5
MLILICDYDLCLFLQDIVNESKFEEKFRVEVDRDESGNVVKMKHRKALDDPLLPAKKRAKLEGERREKRKKRRLRYRDCDKSALENQPVIQLLIQADHQEGGETSLERDLKKKQKGKRKKVDEDDFKHFQDKVEFGEVAYEPPSLDTSKFTKMTNSDTKVMFQNCGWISRLKFNSV